MAVKPNAKPCMVLEQIIEDPPSGLTFQFIAMPETDAPVRLRIYGDIPFGNREILFDRNGAEAGSGTVIGGACPPSWLKDVKG
jgi:hypothetical protein